MSEGKIRTKELLYHHYLTYPKLQIKDLFKFLHQSSFGCEHLVNATTDAARSIETETKDYKSLQKNWIEELDGDFCRVHLDWIKKGLQPDTLAKLFVLSANPAEDGYDVMEDKLQSLLEMTAAGELPFTYEEVNQEILNWKSTGYQACRHSDNFRYHYHPSYRVVRKDLALFLPLFLKIDGMMKEESILIAIEGGSASGKTTLSNLLMKLYDASVFHMDDFFLRPVQRTQERYLQPGGNIDWERFLEEVLLPLDQGDEVFYKAFDCQTLTMKPAIIKKRAGLNVIEGVYSMRPELTEYYDLSVFLNISDQLQKKRICKRNTPDISKMFFEKWIPMEKRYFEKMKAAERCDMVINIEDKYR